MFKLKYNIGDRVRVRDLKEFEENYPKDAYGDYDIPGDYYFTKEMVKTCSSIATITSVNPDGYSLEFDDPDLKGFGKVDVYSPVNWTVWMIRGVD